MNLSALISALPTGTLIVPPSVNLELPVSGLTADSRLVEPGNLFFALAGVKTDGANFVRDAGSRGAVAIVAASGAEIPEDGVPVLRTDDPRLALARMAAAFFGPQPRLMAAVTGTAGKTSVASFLRQIWAHSGEKAAMLGTTGVIAPGRNEYGALTTPDPVALHRLLAELASEGVTHAAMEASSHGLDQRRLDGVTLSVAGFTNLGRDHMDYHPTMENYMAAKMRLFDTLLPKGAPAVIFADDPWSERAVEVAQKAGARVLTVGRKGGFLSLKRVEHLRHKQIAEVHHEGRIFEVDIPLAGDFQISNALVAAGMAIATGTPADQAMAALEHLSGASGRLELVGSTKDGAPVYVDYAHKPEALENVLDAVRPFTTGRIVVVFGCGGDRDRGKRPIMGSIATRLADVVIVTDDNPRSEDPSSIRAEILATASGATEIGDRAEAIRTAVNMLRAGDTLIVAGKGHEQGQTVGDTVLHFSDHEEIRAALKGGERTGLLWTVQEMIEFMGGRPLGDLPEGVTGISIDSRTVGEGDAFFAIKGDKFDGHDFASAAIANGAALLVVAEAKLPALGRLTAPMIVVNDVLSALEDLGRAARARSNACIIAITGSVGKTSSKEMLRRALEPSGEVHASAASFNNHWGVPLTLARMPVSAKYGVFEIGMNHPNEIRPLVKMVRPHVAIITTVAAAHMGNFKNLSEIAAAKAEIMEGVVKNGHILLNRDNEKFNWLNKRASELGTAKVLAFGEHAKADYRLLNCKLLPACSTITARIGKGEVAVKIGAPGRHLVQNALAVLGAVELAGADLAKASHALAAISAERGRGARHELSVDGGSFILIDESYNANPASMRAALELLRDTPVRLRGRRIAVLGDMLEMGKFAERVHRELAEPIRHAHADMVCLSGPEMKALRDELGTDVETVYRCTADDLADHLKNLLRDGDVVMVKSSLGIGFGRIVKALLDKYPALPDSTAKD